ncbi:chemotaxis protein CheW [Acidovorax sp.]|uniref:chemotaxis protein CheW n=1 Tax=Acidovorax sp. TaxID=1872122 RepID=UPI00391F0B7D
MPSRPASTAPTTASGAAATAHEAGEFLAFRLGTESYGVSILGIQEIRFYEPPTRIAGAPPHVLGVIDLRGVVIPVIDLRVCLGLAPSFDASTVTVVINPDGLQTVGLVVDSVSDVVALQAAQYRQMPSLGEQGSTHHVTGLASITQEGLERTLLMLDLPRLLTAQAPAGMAMDRPAP